MRASTTLIGATVDWMSPHLWGSASALALLLLSLWLSLPTGEKHGPLRRGGSVLTGVAGLAILWWAVPRMGSVSYECAFWSLAALAIWGAAATISSRSPVYSAIWFAVSLLGVAALFLLQGAQFLGVATVAVYVGAIVVTFLFVLMLAQPEGQAYFDRVSWGITPRLVGSVTAVLFAVLIASAVTRTDQRVLNDRQVVLEAINESLTSMVPAVRARAVHYERRGQAAIARVTVAIPPDQRDAFEAAADSLAQEGLRRIQVLHPNWDVRRLVFDHTNVMTANHTASLGSRLFSRQLVAIQAAGALLMAALVGAVAIAGRSDSLEK